MSLLSSLTTSRTFEGLNSLLIKEMARGYLGLLALLNNDDLKIIMHNFLLCGFDIFLINQPTRHSYHDLIRVRSSKYIRRFFRFVLLRSDIYVNNLELALRSTHIDSFIRHVNVQNESYTTDDYSYEQKVISYKFGSRRHDDIFFTLHLYYRHSTAVVYYDVSKNRVNILSFAMRPLKDGTFKMMPHLNISVNRLQDYHVVVGLINFQVQPGETCFKYLDLIPWSAYQSPGYVNICRRAPFDYSTFYKFIGRADKDIYFVSNNIIFFITKDDIYYETCDFNDLRGLMCAQLAAYPYGLHHTDILVLGQMIA